MKIKIVRLKQRKYPLCPECGMATIVGYTPPREGIVGTDEGYRTIGTAAYVDWERAHLYCCNGETNCKFQTRFFDLTTPLTEKKNT